MDEGLVVRRVIPADNSCLFNAVGYVMENDRNRSSELRQVIATAVGNDPVHYNEAFLGKLNEEYCAWILDPEKWGGAIELSILADYYGREIAAYDVQTARCDLYGQGKGYTERVMLIYDGLHYDALAVSPFEDAPDVVDQTIFPINRDGSIGVAEALAESLVKEDQRREFIFMSLVPQEKELHRYCKFHFALWGLPDRSSRSKGSSGTCPNYWPC